MKKLFISAMVAVMVVAFGATAFAATTVSGPAFTDIAGHEGEFELTVMKALGVMTGDAGTTIVRPNDGITRAEVSKVLVTMLGRQGIAAGMAGVRPSFTDEIPTWAWGYVNCAQVMGLIQGYEDLTFKPNNQVTYAEVVTMLVRGIAGHKEQVVPGFWPYNFLFYALDNGFVGDVDLSFANLPCPRGDVARMAFATMQINRLAPFLGGWIEVDDSAILAGNGAGQLGFLYTGVLEDYDLAGSEITFNPTKTLADSVYLVGAATFENLMNVGIVAVAGKTDKVLVVGKDESVQYFAGVFKQLLAADGTTPTRLEFMDGTKIPYANPVPTKINGDLGWDDPLQPYDQTHLTQGDECVVTIGVNGKASYIQALHFEAEDYITSVTKSTTSPVADTKIALNTYGAGPWAVPASSRVMVNGALVGRDTLLKYDVVKVAFNTAQKVYELRGVRNTIEGTPSKTWTTYPGPKHWVTIGGVDYENVSGTPLNTTTFYKLGLNAAGQIFVQIVADAETPYVLVKGYTVYSTHKTVTVDNRGASFTYQLDGDPLDETAIGKYGKLTINPITGKVEGWDVITVEDDVWDILAVDKANGTMTLKNQTTEEVIFVDDDLIVIYKNNNTYIGYDGIAVGGTVKIGRDNGDPVIFIYTPKP